MAEIVIKITDQIEKGVPDKISAIHTSASLAEQSVKRLKEALDFAKGSTLKEYAQQLTQIVIQQSNMSKSAIDLAIKSEKLAQSVERTKKAQADSLITNQKLAQAYSKSAVEIQKLETELRKTDVQTKNLAVSQERLNTQLARTAKVAYDTQLVVVRLAQAKNKLAFETATLNDRIAQTAIKTKLMQEQLAQSALRTERNNERVSKGNSLYFAFGTILRTVRLAEYTKSLLESTDAYTLINNRLALVSLSQEHSAKLYKEIYETAQKTRVPIQELAASFVRFDYALKTLGATQKESIRFTKTIAEQLAISGLAVQEQSSALLQLSQALNKGKLDGDEFRTIMETLPTVATAIAKTMGVARGELIKLAPEGKITSDVLRQALASIATETDEKFKKLTPTIGQAFTVISNGALNTMGKFQAFTGVNNVLAESLIFLGTHMEVVAAIAIGVGAISFIKYAQSVEYTTIAIKALNVVMRLNPIGLAIGAVATLTAAMVLYKDEIILANESNSTFGESLKAIVYTLNPFSKEVGEAKKKTNEYNDSLTYSEKAIRGFGILTESSFKYLVILSDKLGVTKDAVGKYADKLKELVEERKRNIEQIIKEQQEEQHLAIQLRAAANANENILKARKVLDKAYKDNKLTGFSEQEERTRQAEETQKFYDIEIIKLRTYKGKDLKIREDSLNLANQLEIASIKIVADIKNPEGAKQLRDDLELQKKILSELNNGTKEYAQTKRVLNDLIEKGLITQAQYNTILSKTNEGQQTAKRVQELEAKAYVNTYESKKKALQSWVKEQLISINYDITLVGKEAEKERQRKLAGDAYFAQLKALDDAQDKKEAKDEARGQKELDRMVNGFKKLLNEFQKYLAQKEKIKLSFEKKEQKVDDSFNRRLQALQRDSSPLGGIINENKTGANELAKQKADQKQLESEYALQKEKEYQDRLYIITKEGKEKINKLEEALNKKKSDNRLKIAEIELNQTSELFSALSNLAKARQGEDSKAAKRSFQIAQSLALASAIVHMAGSISKANDSQGYEKFALIAQASVIGATQIANITAASLQGLSKGGTVGGTGSTTSDSNLVRLSYGEEVIRASVAGPNRSFLKDLNDGKVSTSNFNRTVSNNSQGDSKPIVNIYNYSSDSEATVEHSVVDGQDQFDVIFRKIEDKLAQNVATGSGSLHGTIKNLNSRGY